MFFFGSRRRREARMVLDEVKAFVRLAAAPAAERPVFTAPHHDDADPAHRTMFSARHGHRQLSFILDASRRRVRWWILSERFAPTGERVARHEATFVEGAIPTAELQALLKAARGEPPADPAEGNPAAPGDAPPAERQVDPFEPVASDVPTPTAQA